LPRGKAGEVNGLLGDHQRGWENQFRTLHARNLTAKHTKHTNAFLTTDKHGFSMQRREAKSKCVRRTMMHRSQSTS
jgi:hypothetical protein